MEHRITVTYTAPTEIADPEQLCEYVREQVHQHLRSGLVFARSGSPSHGVGLVMFLLGVRSLLGT